MSLSIIQMLHYLQYLAPGLAFMVMFPLVIVLTWRLTWHFAYRDRVKWLSLHGDTLQKEKIHQLEEEVARLVRVIRDLRSRHGQRVASIRAVQNHLGKVHELLTLADEQHRGEYGSRVEGTRPGVAPGERQAGTGNGNAKSRKAVQNP